jgi:hypothetical protein
MGENTVVIIERDGKYEIQNHGISEFALLGILECIIFDLKSTNRRESGDQQTSAAQPKKVISEPIDKPNETTPNTKEAEPVEKSKDAASETKREVIEQPAAPDLRTRIGNAVKAVRGLGGKIEDTDLSKLTDEELQSELEELTEQYKRLKNSEKA